MKWKIHIDYIVLKVSKIIGIMYRLKFILPADVLLTIYNNNNIFIHRCYNCIEQYIPINNNILRIIKHVMLNI